MKKKVFLKTVLLMLVSSLMLMGCSHSSGSDNYYKLTDDLNYDFYSSCGFTGYDNCDFTANAVEEAVSYIGELTDEGTYVVKVIDTSETSCSSLKEALDSLGEGVLVCLDLSETSLKIGSSEFKECENLSGIALPKMLKEVGSYAFYDCINLKEVYIPDSVTRIGSFAFAGNYYNTNQLKTVTLPKNLKVIEMYTFCGCQNLETVYLPDTLEYIGECAFLNCKNLKNLTKDENNKLSKSLKSMGYGAFDNCTSLTTVYLPETIESIGECAFEGCSSLTNLVIEKESGKAWGHASTKYREESNPSAETLTMIPCFEENAVYFLTGKGTLQCGTSCCQGEGQTCCGEEGSTCACAKLTNSGDNSNCGYSYWWYKVAYPEEEE